MAEDIKIKAIDKLCKEDSATIDLLEKNFSNAVLCIAINDAVNYSEIIEILEKVQKYLGLNSGRRV